MPSPKEIVQKELTELSGFEERLTTALKKALDIVTGEYNERLVTLEEDQARILRHLGLEE